MKIYFNAFALYKTCPHAIISSALPNIFFEIFPTVSMCFPVVSDGSRWFPLVILCFPWLSLVILGYPWLSLVICDSNIYEIVCAFAIIFPVICRITKGNRRKLPEREPVIKYTTLIEEFIRITRFVLYTSGNNFFEAT